MGRLGSRKSCLSIEFISLAVLGTRRIRLEQNVWFLFTSQYVRKLTACRNLGCIAHSVIKWDGAGSCAFALSTSIGVAGCGAQYGALVSTDIDGGVDGSL